MKKNRIIAVIAAISLSAAITACNNSSVSSASAAAVSTDNTAVVATNANEKESDVSEGETKSEKFVITWETIAPDQIDLAIYKMSGGLWYYQGEEDEKSIDMDGLKGLTTYTKEAIPEYEGYLQYLGENPEGLHVFDVLDMSGRQFMTLTFASDAQFYVDGDENEYYVKWDY